MTLRWRRRTRGRIAAWAMLAALAVQWLALGHAVEHASEVAALVEAAGHDSQHALGGDHDAGSSLCQLLDQLLSGQGVAPQAIAVAPCSAPAAQPDLGTPSFDGTPASAYEARAPPRAA
jgi:hypothetical protein